TLTLWSACRFESSVLHVHDATCTLLTRNDMRDLELVEDLRDYAEKSHGADLNWKMGCHLIEEMLQFLTTKEKSERYAAPKLKILVGHAETMMPFIAALGLYSPSLNEEEDLLTCNLEEGETQQRRRRWRSGFVVPFGANVVITVSHCGS